MTTFTCYCGYEHGGGACPACGSLFPKFVDGISRNETMRREKAEEKKMLSDEEPGTGRYTDDND